MENSTIIKILGIILPTSLMLTAGYLAKKAIKTEDGISLKKFKYRKNNIIISGPQKGYKAIDEDYILSQCNGDLSGSRVLIDNIDITEILKKALMAKTQS